MDESYSKPLRSEIENNFHALTESAPVGIFLNDAQGKTTYVNKKCAELVGVTSEEALDFDWIPFLHPDDRDRMVSEWQKAFENSKEFRSEYRWVHSDGKVVWTLGEVNPILGKDGKATMFVGMLTDITAHKEAEKAFRKSQKLLKETSKIGKVGGWEVDIDTGRQRWTEEVCRIHEVNINYDPNLEEGINFYSEASKPVISEAVQRAIENGESFDLELELITAKGNLRYVRVVGMSDLPNRRIYGFFQDITEKAQQDELLRRSNKNLNLAQRIANIGNWTLDPDIGVPEWSEEVYRIYDRAPEDGPYSLSDYKNVYKGEYLDKFTSVIKRAIDQGKPYDVELKLVFAPDRVKWVHALCEPEQKTGSGKYFLRGTIQDITERKLVEEKLSEFQFDLQKTLELSPGIICAANTNTGYFTKCNPAVRNILGYSEKEFLSKPFLEFIHPDDRQGTVDETLKQLKGEPVSKFQNRFECKDGSYKWLSWRGTKADQDGNVYAVATDITELKKTENRLIESEEKVRLVLDSAAEGIYGLDPQGNCTFCNQSCVELLGFESENDLLGRNMHELIHYKTKDGVPHPVENCQIYDAFRTGQKVYLKTEVLWKADGTPLSVELWSYPTIQNGEVTGAVTSFVDISDRLQAQEKLRSSEEQYRNLVEGTPDLISRVNPEGYIVFINHAAPKFYGMQPEECIGKLAFDFIHPEDRSGTTSAFGTWLQSDDSTFKHENRLVSIDGQRTHDVSWTISIERSSDGSVSGFSGIAKDVTEQRLAAREMQEHKATLESLFDSIPDATVLVDQQRSIIAINKAFTETFGYTLDEIAGKPTSVFYESGEEFLRQGRLRFNLSPEEAAEPYIVTYRRKDGSLFPGETIGTKVFTPGGNVMGFFGLMRDVSDRLRQEEAQRQAQKMEAIGTLSGGIAHDFNNLLAIISSNIDIVQHKQKTATDSAENIGHIKEAASRAKSLVEQILTFSRHNDQALSAVDLSLTISDSLKLLRPTIPVSVEIQTRVERGTVFVNADSTQVQQVLINLCANAVDAMNEQGLLKINLLKVDLASNELPSDTEAQPGCYAVISVSDTGHGVEPEYLDRIFDPFFTTKEVGSGTGMGLAVAHGIVSQHGGHITVDSVPGEGTTFHVYLPLLEDYQPAPEVDAEDSLPTGTERILFIDDEECLAETCSELLEYQGYTVASFTNSREALELFREKPEDFDLVFTDQTMPGMTGVELAKELLKIRPEIPIIICSGYTAQISEDDIERIGIREFCLKPMDIKKLATVTRKVLDENNSAC